MTIIKRLKRLFLLLLIPLSLAFLSPVNATIISASYEGGGSFGTNVTTTLVGNVANIDIETGYDPLAGPIRKHFIGDGGAGGILVLEEMITNNGIDPWIGWEESIEALGGDAFWGSITLHSPDGDLTFATIFTDTDNDGVEDTTLPGVTINFTSVLSQGETAHITKEIHYNAGVTDIWVYESPLIGIEGPGEVPIPAAVWLFGSGLLGLVGLARRKKE